MFSFRHVLGVGTAVLLVVVGMTGTSVAQSTSVSVTVADSISCAGSTVTPDVAGHAAAEKAILCLINGYRAANGRIPLRRVTTLRNTALSHGHRMITGGFFGHIDPLGRTLVDRMRSHHYLRRSNSRWWAAENLATAGGELATPHHIVANWMASAVHRANILRSSLRDVGIAVIAGSPTPVGAEPFTVVADFGARR